MEEVGGAACVVTKVANDQYTTVHPLGDVAAICIIASKNDQHHKLQQNNQRHHSALLNEYPNQTGTHRSPLQMDTLRKEVLATYSISRPIHSIILLGDGDDTAEGVSEEIKAHGHADRLEAVQARRSSIQRQLRRNRDNSDNHTVRRNSQLKFVAMVEDMHQNLRNAWTAGEKVKSLRIAIQAVRMLSKVALPSCFPSVYVLVAQVLDTFGDLVAQRLQSTAVEKNYVLAVLIKKGIDASYDLIPAESVETCYNWFLKINSIRELIPRVCIELSLMKCFRFMSKKSRVVSEAVVRRLAMQIRGVADPIVAAHLRWYLSARAREVLRQPGWATIAGLDEAVIDTLHTLEHVSKTFLDQLYVHHAMSRGDYFDLFIPSLQWQFDTIVQFGDPKHLAETNFVRHVVSIINEQLVRSTGLLLCVWQTFPVQSLLSYWSANELLDMTFNATPTCMVSRLRLLKALFFAFATAIDLSLTRAERIAFLNTAWDFVDTSRSHGDNTTCPNYDSEHGDETTHMEKEKEKPKEGANGDVGASSRVISSPELLDVCGAMIQFSAVHMGFKQVNVLLGLVREISSGANAANVKENGLFGMLSVVVSRIAPLLLLESVYFAPLLRQLPVAQRRQLTFTLLKQLSNDSIAHIEPNVVLPLCVALHDDLCDSLEMDSTAEAALVERIFLRILLQAPSARVELKLMCKARQLLSRLDCVKYLAVNRSLALAQRSAARYSEVSKREEAKSLLTFCLVTVPALMHSLDRLRMASLCAGVAFQCGMIVLGDELLDLALCTLNGLDNSFDSHVVDVVLHLLWISIAAPMRQTYLYGVQHVLDWCARMQWPPATVTERRIGLAALQFTIRATQGQYDIFPLCRTEVYAQDVEFTATAARLAEVAVRQLEHWLQHAEEMERTTQSHFTAAEGSLEIFEVVALLVGIATSTTREVLLPLSRNAWRMTNDWAVKSASLDLPRHILRSAHYVQKVYGLDFFAELTSSS